MYDYYKVKMFYLRPMKNSVKKHDLQSFVDTFMAMDDPIVMINDGVIPYNKRSTFFSCISNVLNKNKVRYALRTIKNDQHTLIVFKS